MLNQVDTINEIGKDLFFFVRVAMKSPWAVQDMGYSLAFHGDLWGFL